MKNKETQKKMQEKTLNQLRKKLREKRAPEIFIYNRGDTKILTVIYENKEETYELIRSDSYKELSKKSGNIYTRYHAKELCKNSGGRQIHYKITEEDD